MSHLGHGQVVTDDLLTAAQVNASASGERRNAGFSPEPTAGIDHEDVRRDLGVELDVRPVVVGQDGHATVPALHPDAWPRGAARPGAAGSATAWSSWAGSPRRRTTTSTGSAPIAPASSVSGRSVPRASRKSSAAVVAPSSSSPGIGVPYGDSVGLSQHLEQLALDPLAHHVLPAAGLLVDVLPLQADHVDEQPLGQPVLAHDPHRLALAVGAELEVAVAGHVQQPVALHPGHGLGDGRADCDRAARRSGPAAGRSPPPRSS